MSVSTKSEVVLQAGVTDFLKQHAGEEALQRAVEIVRECVPELEKVEVRLLEDPDVDNHTWVILEPQPAHVPTFEDWRAKHDHFFELLRQKLPLPYQPFSFSLDISPST